MRESSPLLQTLTLSTNLTTTEKLRKQPSVSNTSRDGEQSFTSRTVQQLRSPSQPKQFEGTQSARQPGAVQGRSPLTSPGSSAVRGRLRDVGSEIRKMDVGLHVSAVKVTQRQPMTPVEVSQGANGHSPYSSKTADGKSVSKRKGLGRSATFSTGSSESLGSAPSRDGLMGHAVARGLRPSTAPAASPSHQTSASDSGKQPTKRRQLAQMTELPCALPGFRPSPCLTADNSLVRARHGQRPGTPILKADAAATLLRTGNLTASLRAIIRVPASATGLSSANAAKQDWPLAKMVNGRAAESPLSVPDVHARGSQLLDVEQQSADVMPFYQSDSVSSSSAATYEHRAVRNEHMEPGISMLQAHAMVPEQQPGDIVHEKPLDDAVGTSGSIGWGGQGVAKGTLSSALRSLGTKQHTRDGRDGQVGAGQQHMHASKHMHGNSVLSCFGASQGSAPEAANSRLADALLVQHVTDPLVEQCTQVMHLLGMDDDWYEREFLFCAHNAVPLGP